MTTFSAVLADLLRREPGRPLVTFYDDATGERVELSVTTYANWVAKASSLLVEEHDLERGDTLRVDLPAHWLAPVFLGAAWNAGLAVTLTDEPGREPDAVVCGPDGLDRWAGRAGDVPVLACSLRPLGVRFADPLPAGVHDVGVEVWSQPDSFIPWDPPQDDDAAVVVDGVATTQGALWSAAAAGSLLTDGGRLLSEANPASPPGLATFTEPLARSGSLVLVVNADRERVEATYAAERATARFPA
ncbi:TIGR03089 family protein [Nocardioides sp. zg-579]|uniref:TIGR03089 family protein n=1 Tax=Nocardioides marmotae TaxID=2663857 RepID=A0A6I3JA84_9ACTN|nr:TIGR03089 family protein [Nocardioides marmotae]MCR6031429.1 TIGR03089 family protein [Gordonia jinghuaiqii]MTB95068.1 TIGR03089 family protein [Nocardioides marmotae]QKE02436.1 TIGR03089 family protein [Nocardioides marmotae]